MFCVLCSVIQSDNPTFDDTGSEGKTSAANRLIGEVVQSRRRRFQPGGGPSRGLLLDCTTGCGTDGSFYSTTHNTHYLTPRNLHVFPPLPVSSKVGLSDCITEQRTENTEHQ